MVISWRRDSAPFLLVAASMGYLLPVQGIHHMEDTIWKITVVCTMSSQPHILHYGETDYLQSPIAKFT